MFVLLSRVLLWLLIGTIIFSLFRRFYPSGTFLGRLLLIILLVVIGFAFFTPGEPVISSLWEVVSFPLRPLGAAILLMILASQKMKKGGDIGDQGGYLVGGALAILLFASTPAVAYFLVRAPIAMTGDTQIARQEVIQNYQNAVFTNSPSETLVAFGNNTQNNSVTDIAGDSILTSVDTDSSVLAWNPANLKVSPYLLQNPQEIRRRGLRLEDFVPNAETLQLTTQVWDSYLNQVSFFLRGNGN